ncbi:hypothetical protein [Pseudoalteromonas sp. MMG005]|nr:hypothetical protein [Pseudoalteromonas sp. MMG005]
MIAILGKYIITRLCVASAEYLAKRSDNKIDDEIVKTIKAAL